MSIRILYTPVKVNNMCEEIDYTKMTVEHFKCLVFVCSLQKPEFKDILARLLAKLESKPDTTLNDLREELAAYQMLKQNLQAVAAERTEVFEVNKVLHGNGLEKGGDRPRHTCGKDRDSRGNRFDRHREDNDGSVASQDRDKPPERCAFCGDRHWARNCHYFGHLCQVCGQKGHKDGYCENARRFKERFRNRCRNVVIQHIDLEKVGSDTSVGIKNRMDTIGRIGFRLSWRTF